MNKEKGVTKKKKKEKILRTKRINVLGKRVIKLLNTIETD